MAVRPLFRYTLRYTSAPGGLGCGRKRQVDEKGGAVAWLAHDGDVAAALLDDAVHDRESETGALALLLRREERLEELRARLLVDAGAGVADAQPGVASRVPFDQRDRRGLVQLDLLDFDREAAPVGHRVPCVDHEVEHDLLDLRRVGAHLDRFWTDAITNSISGPISRRSIVSMPPMTSPSAKQLRCASPDAG